MTKFSGERILHTENAYTETIFASNKQPKWIIISNLALFWLKYKTIGDEGITVDFRFIKVHTSN